MSSRPDAFPAFASARAASVEPRPARRSRIALGIRAQLLLVLTVFLAIPWLGYEYVKELERFLRDAQERTLAGTAQAVATALHDRGPLFEARAAPLDTLPMERATEDSTSQDTAVDTPSSPEIAQILHGLSRTTARIWVVDRDQHVLARAGSLRRLPLPGAAEEGSYVGKISGWIDRELLQPMYA